MDYNVITDGLKKIFLLEDYYVYKIDQVMLLINDAINNNNNIIIISKK